MSWTCTNDREWDLSKLLWRHFVQVKSETEYQVCCIDMIDSKLKNEGEVVCCLILSDISQQHCSDLRTNSWQQLLPVATVWHECGLRMPPCTPVLEEHLWKQHRTTADHWVHSDTQSAVEWVHTIYVLGVAVSQYKSFHPPREPIWQLYPELTSQCM